MVSFSFLFLFFFLGFFLADIETYNVDTQLNKVIVTGNVTTEEVIKALHKIGKSASTWESQTISALSN